MNEQQTKAFLGKILGEVYRVQRHLDLPNAADDATVYGLLHGIEDVIDDQLDHIGFVSKEKVEAVVNILNEYDTNKEKLNALSGYYDLEPDMQAAGLSRGDVSKIFKHLKANHRFVEVIEKMKSSFSPVELKDFDLSSYDT